MSCRASCGGLPTRQVVTEDGPHPPVELVTIAATLERGWSSPAVPSACPGATSGPHPTRQQRTTPGNGGRLTSQLDSPSRPASQVVRPPGSLSHGGSQGFKSPHLHPQTALVNGLAGRLRGAGAVPGSPSGQQRAATRERNGQPLLDCGQETERSGHLPDLPITRRMLGVELVGSRRIWPAHVGCLVGPDAPDGSNRFVWMIKAHPTERRMRSERGTDEKLPGSSCRPVAAGWVGYRQGTCRRDPGDPYGLSARGKALLD